MYARIDSEGRCVELISDNPAGRYHPNVKWVPVDDSLLPWITEDYIANGDKLEPPSLDYLRDQLKSALAAHRFDIETGSVELPDGSHILTDRESQAQLTSAYQSLSMPFVESIDWKAADGWVTVTEAELRPIAQAVAQHVQGCFKAERIVSEQIAAAESAEALYGIDIAGAFEEALLRI